jgi:uncharacterized protein YdiU (UPF0061 family)
LLAPEEDEAVKIAEAALECFRPAFESEHAAVVRAKLGLGWGHVEEDRALAEDILERLLANHVDYTLFFRQLCASAADPEADAAAAALFDHPGAFHEWASRWRARVAREDVAPAARAAAMRLVNPAFIPRNHRIEEAITAATSDRDFGLFEALLDAVTRPFDDRPELARLADPPKPEERVVATFCGT